MGGYALAKFDFPGKKGVFAVVLGAVAVPGTALAVPTFLMFSKMGLTDTPWAVIIPSLISPFGLYLMWTFATDAIPTELMEAAKMDGASELRTFVQVSLPLLAPGIVTVLLFSMVATWNNYFLPLIMLKDPDWYPLTVGLNAWSQQALTAGGDVDLQPRHHRIAPDDRAAHRGLPAPAALLAVRAVGRKRQGMTPQAQVPTSFEPTRGNT